MSHYIILSLAVPEEPLVDKIDEKDDNEKPIREVFEYREEEVPRRASNRSGTLPIPIQHTYRYINVH
jgi:hypothetical protein